MIKFLEYRNKQIGDNDKWEAIQQLDNKVNSESFSKALALSLTTQPHDAKGIQIELGKFSDILIDKLMNHCDFVHKTDSPYSEPLKKCVFLKFFSEVKVPEYEQDINESDEDTLMRLVDGVDLDILKEEMIKLMKKQKIPADSVYIYRLYPGYSVIRNPETLKPIDMFIVSRMWYEVDEKEII